MIEKDRGDNHSIDDPKEAGNTEDDSENIDVKYEEIEDECLEDEPFRPHTSTSSRSEDCSSEKENRKNSTHNFTNRSKMKLKKNFPDDGDQLSLKASFFHQLVNQSMAPQDHISAFGEFVASKIRALKNPRLQSLAQINIHKVLHDLEFSPYTQPLQPDNLVSTVPTSSVNSYNLASSANDAGTPSAYPVNTLSFTQL